MTTTAYSLAVEEGRRSLDEQVKAVESVRSRAVALLTIGGLAAAFIGGLARSPDDQISPATWVAAAMFVASAASALLVLLPRAEFVGQKPGVLIDWVDIVGATPDQMERGLAQFMARQIQDNDKSLGWFNRVFKAGTVFVVSEVAFLIASLGGL